MAGSTVAIAGMLAVSLAGPAATGHAVTSDWRARMLDQVNATRTAAGVGPVRLCAELNRSAERYSRAMARAGQVTHTPADGTDAMQRMQATGYEAQVAGENLAGGQTTVIRVMRAWRASPSHYRVLVDPRLTHVGFGHARDDDSRYRTYWVQHFGAGDSCG